MQQDRNQQLEVMKLRRRMVHQARVPHRLPKRPTEIEQLNHQIEPTYYFDRADPLYKIPRLLDCIPGQRDDMTAQIIEALQSIKCAELKKPTEI